MTSHHDTMATGERLPQRVAASGCLRVGGRLALRSQAACSPVVWRSEPQG